MSGLPHLPTGHGYSEQEGLLVEEYFKNNPDAWSAFKSYEHAARGYETQDIFGDFLRVNPNIKQRIECYIATNCANITVPP